MLDLSTQPKSFISTCHVMAVAQELCTLNRMHKFAHKRLNKSGGSHLMNKIIEKSLTDGDYKKKKKVLFDHRTKL